MYLRNYRYRREARWVRRAFPWIMLCLWLFHLWTAVWFLTHSEVVEAKVLRRTDYSFPGKQHGFSKLEVSYPEPDGKIRIATVNWHATHAPEGERVRIRHAHSGLRDIAPASVLECFWFEAGMALIAVGVGVFALIAKATQMNAAWQKRRLTDGGNPFTRENGPPGDA
jgi:hypothetical protein